MKIVIYAFFNRILFLHLLCWISFDTLWQDNRRYILNVGKQKTFSLAVHLVHAPNLRRSVFFIFFFIENCCSFYRFICLMCGHLFSLFFLCPWIWFFGLPLKFWLLVDFLEKFVIIYLKLMIFYFMHIFPYSYPDSWQSIVSGIMAFSFIFIAFLII